MRRGRTLTAPLNALEKLQLHDRIHNADVRHASHFIIIIIIIIITIIIISTYRILRIE